MNEIELAVTTTYDISLNGGPTLRTGALIRADRKAYDPTVGQTIDVGETPMTITSIRGPLHYSGKFNGWISRRSFVLGEHDILGHRGA